MATDYYACEPPTPPLLLRRDDHVDEVFRGGTWHPTKMIIDYMFGHNDDVEGPISEDEARVIAPHAFT